MLGNQGDASKSVQVGGNVGAGSVIINGAVTIEAAAAAAVHVDRRIIADTLQAMRPLNPEQHLSVILWMERQFGTQLVKALSAESHRRVRRYVAAVLKEK